MCRVTPNDKSITIMGLHEANIGSILVTPHKVIVGFLFFYGQDQKMEEFVQRMEKPVQNMKHLVLEEFKTEITPSFR